MKTTETSNESYIALYLAWFVALTSTAGSFFFSHFMKLPPCSLCWYQRIFMFPLALILGIAYFRRDQKQHLYSLPLILIGLGIAIYHNLLYYGIISQPLVPCSGGVSCSEKQLELFGFVTIPLLSLLAFTAMLGLVVLQMRTQKDLK